MPTIYDERNIHELVDEARHRNPQYGNGWMATPTGRQLMAAAPRFADNFPVFDRETIFEKVKEQEARQRSIEDFQNFEPHDQNGFPSCWRNGPAHAFTTLRVIWGLPLEYISSMSLCPEHSPYTGGDEWDAGTYLQESGAATFKEWENNDPNMRLTNDAAVIAARKNHIAFQLYRFDGSYEQIQLQMATAYTMDPPMPCGFAYWWWSHVTSGGRTRFSGSTASSTMINRQRNNWGPWGDKNRFGFYGYYELAEGSHGTPGSGFAFGPPLQTAA